MLLGVVSLYLVACATSELVVKSKITKSVFINPVKKELRTVFVSVRNTSGADIDLDYKINKKLIKNGYKIVDDPDMAQYILMANVLYADKRRENNTAGGAVLGGAAGGGIASYNSGGSATQSAGGALAGALLGGLIGSWTEDTIWQMQVDILIRERARSRVYNTHSSSPGQASIKQGKRAGFANSFSGRSLDTQGGSSAKDNINSHSSQTYESQFIERRTLIFAEATKKDLSLQEATPILEEKISSQIAGIF